VTYSAWVHNSKSLKWSSFLLWWLWCV